RSSRSRIPNRHNKRGCEAGIARGSTQKGVGRSEIGGNPILLPVAVADGVWAIAAAELFRPIFGLGLTAPLLGFLERALRSRSEPALRLGFIRLRHWVLLWAPDAGLERQNPYIPSTGAAVSI